MRLRFPFLAGAAAILVAGSANAQFLQTFDETLWGVQGSFTPTWSSLDQFRSVISASSVDMSGSEFTIGFARGRMSAGHWGLSLVRQRVEAGSVCFADEPECLDPANAGLQGLEFSWFLPFGSPFAGDRVQVGMNVGLGAGWYNGTVHVGGFDVAADRWLRLLDRDNAPVPIVRGEFAVAGTLAPGFKVIATGGYGMPGNRRLSLNLAFFPMAGR